MFPYTGELDLDEGLVLIGWNSDEEPIRYERETNRIFIRSYEDGIKYLAVGKLLTMIDTLDGCFTPVIASDYSLHHEISQFLFPRFLKVQ